MEEYEAERLAALKLELEAEDAAKAAKLAAMSPAERAAWEAANSYEAKFGHIDDEPESESDDEEDEAEDDSEFD